MKVLLIGHSYVRDLQDLGYDSFIKENIEFSVKYVYKNGGNYKSMLDDTELLETAFNFHPDIVIVILAANSLKNNVPNSEIHIHCRNFYQLLRIRLPKAKIIAAQIELRFYSATNQWDAPEIESYEKRRRDLNNFLKRLKLKDAIMMVAGPNRIDNRVYYRDGVHLNSVGVRKYFDFVKCTVASVYRKSLCWNCMEGMPTKK